MFTYKLVKNEQGAEYAVMRSNGWSIPFDPANTDYQEYLKWLSEGNTPEPANEVTP